MPSESLGICQALEVLTTGKLDASTLVNDCLQRIDEFEPTIKAWAWLNAEHAQRQAEALDQYRRQQQPLGKLHGIPIGIKDIIDTKLIPTEHGFPLFAGRLPKKDATLVARLRQQGAIIMGKTVTAPLATFMPGKTTNPHNAAHTPGGSSSGSAAAVAAFMLPGAVGTQTNGSVIRPAAFCGTVGFKPSYGLIPRTGVLTQSPFLDQVGVFARNVEDAALLAEVMMGSDNEDSASHPHSIAPPLHQICSSEPPIPPRIAWIRTTQWSHCEDSTQAAYQELVDALGEHCQIDSIDLPDEFDAAWNAHQTINEGEMATWYAIIHQKAKAQLAEQVQQQIERGQKLTVPDYLNAQAQRPRLLAWMDEFFESYDAILTPAAPGEAPKGLSATGDPRFSTLWTFCGLPCINLPVLQGDHNLPIGAQLVGNYLDDGRLLRTARWAHETLATARE